MKQLDLFENRNNKLIESVEDIILFLENKIKNLEEEQFYIDNKAFEWEDEFPQCCDEHGNFTGFDAIVGNPPYIFSRNKKFNKYQKEYYNTNYKLNSNQLNTFIIFIEKSILLTNITGTVGLIVPNNLLTINSFSKIRKHIIENFGNLVIINILDKVFNKANVDTCIILFNKNINNKLLLGEIENEKIVFQTKINKNEIIAPNYIFQISLHKNKEAKNIIEKIEKKSIILKELATVSTGLKVYQIGKGKPKQTETIKKNRKFHSLKKKKNYSKYLRGADVKRFSLQWSGEYLKYGIWIAEMRKTVPFVGERILVRQIPNKLPYCINATYTKELFYNDINSMVIFNSKKYDLRYILAILNSKLISFWFVNKFDKLQRNIFPQFKVNELSDFPIFSIDINNKIYTKIIKLVENIYTEQNIKKYSNQIDKLVYKLYNISNKEIKIIENATT